MKHADIEWFQKEKEVKNPVFLGRFPGLSCKGLKVVDLGCGHGAISVDLALKGAEHVIGIDIKSSVIEFANENLRSNYPELSDKITFQCADLKELENDTYDMIISKASFEHIQNLDLLLIEMKKKLKPGGKIVTGFGPLYNTPWGDHNRLRHKLPWSHLLFGEKHFIRKLNKKRKNKVESIHDLGLNGYSLKEYRTFFTQTEGLTVVDFRTNVSEGLVMKMARYLTTIPLLREYFTYNIYCILERTG